MNRVGRAGEGAPSKSLPQGASDVVTLLSAVQTKYSKFPYFRNDGNKGRTRLNFSDNAKLANFENPGLVQVSGTYLLCKPVAVLRWGQGAQPPQILPRPPKFVG